LDNYEYVCAIGKENCIKETDEYKNIEKEIAMMIGATNNDVFFKYSLSQGDWLYSLVFDVYFFRHLLLAVEDKKLTPDEAWRAYLDNTEDKRVANLVKKEEFDRS